MKEHQLIATKSAASIERCCELKTAAAGHVVFRFTPLRAAKQERLKPKRGVDQTLLQAENNSRGDSRVQGLTHCN
ncbi:hypothetical protein NDU88_004976 [Pleurodeles waltl]|uniref:Uncharacterized protein n=1 Tax=Pleurodeles waltl TaxID=8319 RepID=A0AAV7PFJ8_PLEWA|nr:hypothetical protein NDU88_004976 [Pleurodeles waltl]